MPSRITGHACFRIQRLSNWVRQFVSDSIFYSQAARLDFPFDIHRTAELRNPEQIKIEKHCSIKAYSILNGRSAIRSTGISLGPDVYFKERCYVDSYGGFIEVAGACAFAQSTFIHGGGGVSIGRNVIVGANSCIIASNHKFESEELPIMLQGDRRKGIQVGNNVWLGAGVIVLDGVTIGDNCVVGAGTVIKKSVSPNSVVFSPTEILRRDIFHE